MRMAFLSRGFKNLQWYSMTEQIRTSDLDALIFFIRRKELDTDTHARSAFQLEVRQGSCELRNAIRGMPGSGFELRSPHTVVRVENRKETSKDFPRKYPFF